jgi:hypothetical protein
MKVAELEGALLNYWVGRACGIDSTRLSDDGSECFVYGGLPANGGMELYAPSTDWSEAGPIIEREGIGVWEGYESESHGEVKAWEAADGSPVHAIEITGPMGKGPTPLIAAMRAFVRLKFGKEVEDAPQGAG